MKNLAGLMKQASQMQARMEEMQTQIAQLSAEGQSGAGMVRVTLGGKGAMTSLVIDPKLADPADLGMIQDLVIAAHADARTKLEALSAEKMREATGGLDLPAGLKLPF